MKTITDRDCFRATTAHDRPPRLLYHADFTPDLRDRLVEHAGTEDLPAYFGFMNSRGLRLKEPDGHVAPDYSTYWEGEALPPGATINQHGVAVIPSGMYHFYGYLSPLRNARTLSEIEKYPLEDVSGWEDGHLAGEVRHAHEEDCIVQGWVGHMYETAWQIRGYEPFLMDLLTQRDWAELLLDRICANNVRTAAAAARAGYDCIATGDDVANQQTMMFQPELWREVMKPRWARVIAAARAIKPDIHVWYHSDGNIWDILDDLVEIGITILNPVQPECMNPLEIRKRFGKRLAFDGCIGTQTTFPYGTPESMRKTVAALARDLDALNGGLMLSPTHVLEPDIPPRNVAAFFEACDHLKRC